MYGLPCVGPSSVYGLPGDVPSSVYGYTKWYAEFSAPYKDVLHSVQLYRVQVVYMAAQRCCAEFSAPLYINVPIFFFLSSPFFFSFFFFFFFFCLSSFVSASFSFSFLFFSVFLLLLP